MPKGFVKLERFDVSPCYVAVDQIARWGQSHPRGTYVTLKDTEDATGGTVIVDHTPEQVAEMIEAAQQDAPRRSEFAESMGGAMVAAFGGARR